MNGEKINEDTFFDKNTIINNLITTLWSLDTLNIKIDGFTRDCPLINPEQISLFLLLYHKKWSSLSFAFISRIKTIEKSNLTLEKFQILANTPFEILEIILNQPSEILNSILANDEKTLQNIVSNLKILTDSLWFTDHHMQLILEIFKNPHADILNIIHILKHKPE